MVGVCTAIGSVMTGYRMDVRSARREEERDTPRQSVCRTWEEVKSSELCGCSSTIPREGATAGPAARPT
jgi:hypothetical protein